MNESHLPPKRKHGEPPYRKIRKQPHVRYANHPRDKMGKEPREVTVGEIAEHKRKAENAPNLLDKPFEKETATSVVTTSPNPSKFVDLEYESYVSAYQLGIIRVFIDRSFAYKFCDNGCLDYTPPSLELYKSTRCWLWIPPLLALVNFFFIPWYLSLLALVGAFLFSFVILGRVITDHAILSVIETSLMDEDIYNNLKYMNLIFVNYNHDLQ